MKTLALLIGFSLLVIAGCSEPADVEAADQTLTRYGYLYYLDRVAEYREKGDFESARKELKQLFERLPQESDLLDAVAFALMDSPDNKAGEYDIALKLATRACELTDFKQPNYLDTLGAAYSLTGDFQNAIRYQKKAVQLAKDVNTHFISKKLKLYREGKPYVSYE